MGAGPERAGQRLPLGGGAGADDGQGLSHGLLALLLPVEALVGRPELLAYFIPQGVEPRIESGTLLGAARGGAALPLPVLANGTPGVIALYDLANDDVVATLHLPRRGAS